MKALLIPIITSALLSLASCSTAEGPKTSAKLEAQKERRCGCSSGNSATGCQCSSNGLMSGCNCHSGSSCGCGSEK